MNATLADPARTVYRYTNTGLEVDIRGDLNVSEEYNTVGLYHVVEFPANDEGFNYRRFYIPLPGALTENTLRAEHGLNSRIAY